MSYTGPITATCYNGVSETVTQSTYQSLLVGDTLLTNVLYNAGYMYTDVYNVMTNDPSTVNDWPYFLAYQLGDFVARFVY